MNNNKKTRLITELVNLSDNKDFFAKDGEKFNSEKHCIIWTTAEESWQNDLPLADYYDCYEGCKAFNDWLSKNGLMFEWQDPGTIMIYENL